jgi:hypothetical protein
MAVSMAATLALPAANFISGNRFTATLTLTESGGTSTNLVSIQPYITNGAGQYAGNARIGTVSNSLTMANLTGAAVTINASTSATFNFDCVIDGHTQNRSPSEPSETYYLGATVQTSDGSVFSAAPLAISLSLPLAGNGGNLAVPPNGTLGQSVILGTTTNQYTNTAAGGQTRFDYPANTALYFFFV